MRLGCFCQSAFQLPDVFQYFLDFFFQIEPDVYGYLVVSASGGMQPLAGSADPFCKKTFDIHVNVFLLDGKCEDVYKRQC